MADDYKNQKDNDELLPRRGFVALSVAAGVAVSAASAEAAVEVVETNVDIKTPDGTCDAAFYHPKSGSHAGVLIWPDAAAQATQSPAAMTQFRAIMVRKFTLVSRGHIDVSQFYPRLYRASYGKC